jgi:hypothetical protein
MDWLMDLLYSISRIFSRSQRIEEKPQEKPTVVESPIIIESENSNNEKPENMYDWTDLKPLDISSSRLVQVNWSKFYKTEHIKNQIALHHTVSGPGIEGDLKTWKDFSAHISTCTIIDRDGTVNQLFSSRYWGYHLGAGNAKLDQGSIGIEIDSWGGLILGDGGVRKFGKRNIQTRKDVLYNVYGGVVDVPATHYPGGWRGYEYYESYTYEQIRSVGKLLLLWSKTYNIPLTYNEDMWDVSQRALAGAPGVWAHVSYRPASDKQDVHPDPNLIDMLRTLPNLL